MTRSPFPANLNAALVYASYGWHVIPVWWAVNGVCACSYGVSCESAGKHPATPHGYKDASIHEAKIRSWFESMPNANVGIATGKISNLAVLDIDPRNNGLSSLELVKHLLPNAPTVITGGGGLHMYFQYHEAASKFHKQLGKGIDVQSDKKIIVAPPSLHSSGNVYKWSD